VRNALVLQPLASHSTSKRIAKLGSAKIRAEDYLSLINLNNVTATFADSKISFFVHSSKGAIAELKSLMNQ